jgi:protein-tyrosine phosphatase
MAKKVLFICTGNYYRSRFAEAVFNHHARLRLLPWQAFSRGLAINEVTGDLSPFTFHALLDRNIDFTLTGSTRVQLSAEDLQAADLAIALKETEHRPLMTNLFPFWVNRVTYWEEHDLDAATAEVALPQIEKKVLALLDQLALQDLQQFGQKLATEMVSPTSPTKKLAGKTPAEIKPLR